ncbi:MAG: diacylglycerol/lipid kinase family protein [Sphingomonadales bacterium]
MKKRIWFIINPISGVRRKDDIPALIRRYLNHDLFSFEIQYTQYKGHAIEIAQEAVQLGVDIVCAVGGDGSVHEVGTSLINTQTSLAVIPIGSGNGLARHMFIPRNIRKAIETINLNHQILMDTVLVNDQPFLGVGGYGLDAIIAKKFDEDKKRGFWTYVKHVFKEFFRYNPMNISIDANGQIKKMPVVLCTIANTSEFGNGFKVSPKSDATDGKLELFLLKPFSFFGIPKMIFQFFTGRSDRSSYAEVISFKKAKISIPNGQAHHDGEPLTVTHELNVRVVPHSLHIIVGQK